MVFLASLLQISLLLTGLVVLCQLPFLTVNSPEGPRRRVSCIHYAAHHFFSHPKVFRVLTFTMNILWYHGHLQHWRLVVQKLQQESESLEPQKSSEEDARAAHELHMRLFQQNWYYLRLTPPTEARARGLSWLRYVVGADGVSYELRLLFATGFTFYSNFQRTLPDHSPSAELLTGKREGVQRAWCVLPSPDTLYRFFPSWIPSTDNCNVAEPVFDKHNAEEQELWKDRRRGLRLREPDRQKIRDLVKQALEGRQNEPPSLSVVDVESTSVFS
ncbi:hypothetical protein F4777DRAFT_554943 [Nemania sp. FL0916]|nr:hypothetical protein F4777DRAFT_554943 [Nemania sp. FL0916]